MRVPCDTNWPSTAGTTPLRPHNHAQDLCESEQQALRAQSRTMQSTLCRLLMLSGHERGIQDAERFMCAVD